MTRAVIAQTPAAPQAPATPAAAPAPRVSTRELAATPTTAQEVAGLQARRQMLSDQLISVSGRRREVAAQLRNATGADRTGLEQRLGVLDARIARLEADIDESGQQISAAPAALIATQQDPAGLRGNGWQRDLSEAAAPLLGVFMLFVLFPLAVSISRTIWKRASVPRQGVAVSPDTTQRLERIEQAVEAIAVEVERVSEGQRFVTRLLAEGHAAAAAVPQPAKEPLAVPRKNPTPV
jgi:hypothetical protein